MIYKLTSPFGTISYDWDGQCCSQIWLHEHAEAIDGQDNPVSLWFQNYFSKQPASLPPLANPATPFQEVLRDALQAIPRGEVRTYGELADQLKTSPRGLGQALGANPFPIMIPCHRVISANDIGGYAYDLTWKKKLLNFER